MNDCSLKHPLTSSLSVLSLLLSLCISTAFSSEIDSVTERKKLLSGTNSAATEFINDWVKEQLLASIQQTTNCNRDAFYLNLILQVGGKVLGDGFLDAVKKAGHKLTLSFPPLNDSVYGQIPAKDKLLFQLSQRTYHPSFQAQGMVIGTDKVGHFMETGYLYFMFLRRHPQAGLLDVLMLGHRSEKTIFGLSITGIYSRGDLAANYAGLLFWQNLLGDIRIPDTRTKGNYLVCQNGRFALNPRQPFDIRDYLTPAWDEGLNCNSYISREMNQPIQTHTAKYNDGKHCPINPNQCLEIYKLYQYQPLLLWHIMSPECKQHLNITIESLGIPEDPFEQNDIINFNSHGRSAGNILITVENIFTMTIWDILHYLERDLERL